MRRQTRERSRKHVRTNFLLPPAWIVDPVKEALLTRFLSKHAD